MISSRLRVLLFVAAGGALSVHGRSLTGTDTLSATWWPSMTFTISEVGCYEPLGRNRLVLGGRGELASDALPLAFTYALLKNKFLDDPLKDQAQQQLLARNRAVFAYRMLAGGHWPVRRWLFQRPACVGVALELFNSLATRFSRDAFVTIFYGNANQAGRWAVYDKTSFLNYRGQRLSLSARQQRIGSKHVLEWGAALHLLAAQQATALQLQQGSLYTEPNGLFLEASYRFHYTGNAAFPLRPWPVAWSGSLDLFGALTQQNGGSWAFFLNDFGFLYWNKSATHYEADSNILYTGIEVQQIFSPDDSSFFIPYSIDTLLKYLGAKQRQADQLRWIPATAALSWQKALNDRWRLGIGMVYRFYPDRLPLVYLKPTRQFADMHVSGLVSFGGLAGYALGVDVCYRPENGPGFHLSCENLLPLWAPLSNGATAVFLKFSWTLP